MTPAATPAPMLALASLRGPRLSALLLWSRHHHWDQNQHSLFLKPSSRHSHGQFHLFRESEAHHSWMGQSTKIVTREVVYYILSGTPRAPQKCFWSNLRVEFLGENHLFLICEKMPNQTLQLIKYLDSGWNSDLFEKKNCWNPSTNCQVRAVQKWLPFSKNVQKLLSVTVQTCLIWIFFFLNRS